MKMISFSGRCMKEILRDPINLAFGIGFPVVLLLLLNAIQSNIPVRLYEIERLAPGVAVFGLSFTTLFSATLIAKDRESAFLARLYTTPMRSVDFIIGYTLPILPMAAIQCTVCYLVAIALGLPLSVNLIWGIIMILPIALFYVSLGLLCGSMLGVKQVGGICGALLTNLASFMSGVWFDLELVGGAFQWAANLLPFVHASKIEIAIIAGDSASILPHLIVVMGYTLVVMAGAVLLFLRQMKRQ